MSSLISYNFCLKYFSISKAVFEIQGAGSDIRDTLYIYERMQTYRMRSKSPHLYYYQKGTVLQFHDESLRPDVPERKDSMIQDLELGQIRDKIVYIPVKMCIINMNPFIFYKLLFSCKPSYSYYRDYDKVLIYLRWMSKQSSKLSRFLSHRLF